MDALRQLFRPLFTPTQVWRSSRYRSYSIMIDRFSFWFTIINNALIMRNHSRYRLLLWPLTLHYSLIATWVGCAVLQQAWFRLSPESYFQHRYLVQLNNRLSRLLATAAFLRHLRLITKPPPHTATSRVLLIATIHPNRPKMGAALTFALFSTGAFNPIMHAVNPPMPLMAQLTIQVGYLAMLLGQQASTAKALLDVSHFLRQYTTLCNHLNSILYSAALLCGHVVNHRQLVHECSANATWLVVLFTNLYFGIVIPLYVSYWLERYFWLAMHDGDGAPVADARTGASVAMRVLKANMLGLSHVLLHVLLLAYAAGLTWVLVMAAHPHLGRWLLPEGAAAQQPPQPWAELSG